MAFIYWGHIKPKHDINKKAAQIEALVKMNTEGNYEKLKEVYIFNMNAYLFGEEEIDEPSDDS